MPKEEKVRAVEELKEKLSQSTFTIGTGYQGLSVQQMNTLRSRLRSQGLEYKVVKNTLALIAAREAGQEGVKELIEGPTGLVFSFGDAAEAAKALDEYIRSTRSPLAVRGALLGDRLLSGSDVGRLASLPPREQLVAQLLGQMQAPIARLLYVLNGPLQGLATVLQRRVEQAGGAEASS